MLISHKDTYVLSLLNHPLIPIPSQPYRLLQSTKLNLVTQEHPINYLIYIWWCTCCFPVASNGKESACNAGDLDLIPWLGESPGGKYGKPLQYSCLENPHGHRSLVGSLGSQTVRHGWVTKHIQCTCFNATHSLLPLMSPESVLYVFISIPAL